MRADSAGEVKTRNYIEIAESLGPFKCTLINGGQDWLIELRIIVPKAKRWLIYTLFTLLRYGQVLPTKGLSPLPIPHSDENCYNKNLGDHKLYWI